MRRRNANIGIYDPPEPSVKVLPDSAKQLYDGAFEQAMTVYRDKGIAESTAWRRTRMAWREGSQRTWEACSGGTCVPWPAAQKLPKPKSDLVGLGVLVEYGYIGKDGVLRVWATDPDQPPILWWDAGSKMLYAFPGTPYPACMLDRQYNTSGSTEQLYETWTKRKPVCGVTDMQIPAVKIHCVGAADTVSYRSDKWNERIDDPRAYGAQEYIHKHWHDVWTWMDNEKNPRAIMIEGGELDVHAKGIIH